MPKLLEGEPPATKPYTVALSEEEAEALEALRWEIHAKSIREVGRYVILDWLRAHGKLPPVPKASKAKKG